MTIIQDLLVKPGGSTPWANAHVTVAPAAAFFLDDGTEIRSSSSDLTDATGLVSFTLPPTPDGFFFWWTYPDGTPRPFSVPASGTHWLKDCLTSPTLPPGITGLLTKAEADSDYAALLTPVGAYTYDANGNVTGTPDGTTYVWESDGAGGYRVHTETASGVTRTFTYNIDGTIGSVA